MPKKKKTRKTLIELSALADHLSQQLDENTSCDAERICAVSFMQFGVYAKAAYTSNKAFEKMKANCDCPNCKTKRINRGVS